jgi:hypothetical protein
VHSVVSVPTCSTVRRLCCDVVKSRRPVYVYFCILLNFFRIFVIFIIEVNRHQMCVGNFNFLFFYSVPLNILRLGQAPLLPPTRLTALGQWSEAITHLVLKSAFHVREPRSQRRRAVHWDPLWIRVALRSFISSQRTQFAPLSPPYVKISDDIPSKPTHAVTGWCDEHL